MTSTTVELPHLEVFQRVLELPLIELALARTVSTYSRLKDSYQLVNWALTCVETSIGNASRQVAPYAKTFEPSLSFVDHKLCHSLDQIERKMPIVKEKPELILEKSYMLALETMRPAVSTISYANDYVTSRAATIKDISWNKMNEILSTEYGTAAVIGLDNTAFLLEMLIDKYFPPIGKEDYPEMVSMHEDKLLHTLQTLGRLSNKTARRVFAHVAHQLRTLNKDNLRVYLSNLVEFLQMARGVHLIMERWGSNSSSNISLSTSTPKPPSPVPPITELPACNGNDTPIPPPRPSAPFEEESEIE